MHSNLLIVAILTIGFTLASSLAYFMQRIGLPSILGYLIAGYLIGPYSPGFVADAGISEQLAEIGVILMLFGVGLHFKIEDLIRVKGIAIPGAIGQTCIATICAALVVYAMGWSLQAGWIIGLSIGVASTVVLVRLLTDNHILHTKKGHIAVGWLIVEDILTVLILILLPTFAEISKGASLSFMHITGSVLLVIVQFTLLVLFMFTIGQNLIVTILTSIARTRSQELFTLTILALVFLIAIGSNLIFGASLALGAFIAGMIIGKTDVKHQAAANALPLKDIFAVIFFLSVGMLFNPISLSTHLPLFFGLLGVILIVKPLAAYAMTLLFGYSLNVALTVAIALAQIGEFSFILAEEAMNLELIPQEGFDVLVACALVSITLNPLLFQKLKWLESFTQKFSFSKSAKNEPKQAEDEKLERDSKVLVIGFGPIGREISKILTKFNLIPTIIEQNIDTVANGHEHQGLIFGDASEGNILTEAHIEKATHLFITIPDTEKTVKIIHAARSTNPAIRIIARTQYLSENPQLEKLHVDCICTESMALKAFNTLIRQFFSNRFET